MIRRVISIDPGMSGTGLVDLLMDGPAITEMLGMDVIKPPTKGDYPARFQALYTGVLGWLDIAGTWMQRGGPDHELLHPTYLIEQPTSDWTAARGNARGQGTVAILGGAWACCCLAVASRVNADRIHQVPSQKWVPSGTKKATYLAIVEAAEKHDAKVHGRKPVLTGQPEHLIAAVGFAKWWVMEQERAAVR